MIQIVRIHLSASEELGYKMSVVHSLNFRGLSNTVRDYSDKLHWRRNMQKVNADHEDVSLP